MNKMPKISEVLHKAADFHLQAGGRGRPAHNKSVFSCLAIYKAVKSLDHDTRKSILNRIDAGLVEMGLEPNMGNFVEIKCSRERQVARYNWLKFAAMVAEEQGV